MRKFLPVAAVLLTAGCGDSTGPGETNAVGTYNLQMVSCIVTRTIREALTLSEDILTPRLTDDRLTAEEQAHVRRSIRTIELVLFHLRADNTLPEYLRTPLTDQLANRVEALNPIETRLGLPAAEFYNALDLMLDSANTLREGMPTFGSCL